MAKKPILGLFETADNAADAGDALKAAGVSPADYDFLTDTPYPEGAFGERPEPHKLYIFPFVGALIGLTVGIMRSEERRVGKEGRSRWSPCP